VSGGDDFCCSVVVVAAYVAIGRSLARCWDGARHLPGCRSVGGGLQADVRSLW
jgi:hypothetical protein